MDAAGLAAVGGEWRVREAAIVPVAFRRAGADGQPGDEPSSTFDVAPAAGWADFDDSAWPVVPPAELSARRGGGRLSFVWYVLRLAVPETVGGTPVAGRDLVLSVSVDDAAEVWVDGELRRCPGQRGGSMLAGWNAENRVVVARDAQPGRTVRVAVFGVNGPLSGAATNYVWMRSARLELVDGGVGGRGARAVSPACEENVLVERLDPRLDAVLSHNPKLFVVGEGFTFAAGPVWDPANGGALLFSAARGDERYRWSERGGVARAESVLAAGSELERAAADGERCDESGHRYRIEDGRLRILDASGATLGEVRTPRPLSGLAWGEDGSVLYLAARDHLYRMPTRVRGHAPHLAPPPRVVRHEREFDALVPPDAAPELVAAGHHWLEGPAWDAASGELLYSDIPRNSIYGVKPGQRPRLARTRAGYSGTTPFDGKEPGSNGLTFDGESRLLACQHGDRRVVRFEADGSRTVIADRYDGRRLNSPNDLIALANGEVWFTDPPFGLPGWFDDAAKELPFQGVYRVTREGEVKLLTGEVRAPNGLALAPDGRTLYVSNAEPGVNAVVYAFDVRSDATLGARRVFVDLTAESRAGAPGAPDGLEVDADGNVWLAGPGGVHVYTPAGRHLGGLAFDRPAANLELGGDGFLYVTADTAIWRIATAARRARP